MTSCKLSTGVKKIQNQNKIQVKQKKTKKIVPNKTNFILKKRGMNRRKLRRNFEENYLKTGKGLDLITTYMKVI